MKTHRAAYELTKGPIPEGLEVMHLCDRPLCCNPLHLQAGTRLENEQDKDRKGRRPRPSHTKLNELAVREIRASGRFTAPRARELAKRFGVTPGAIASILYGNSWRWVDAEAWR